MYFYSDSPGSLYEIWPCLDADPAYFPDHSIINSSQIICYSTGFYYGVYSCLCG